MGPEQNFVRLSRHGCPAEQKLAGLSGPIPVPEIHRADRLNFENFNLFGLSRPGLFFVIVLFLNLSFLRAEVIRKTIYN